ncbi:MAG: hypothetical protein ACYSXF_06650 [Planctomycetota bacterium]|jgi:hypothetical protein
MSGVTATDRGRRAVTTAGLNGLRAWLNNDQRRVARRVSIAMEQALNQQRCSRAERLATAADRLAIGHSRVAESLARLRLAQDRPQAALAVIEACRSTTASLRFLRDVCLIQLGRAADAHIDLHRWSRRSTAPLEARRLLGLLEWLIGDPGAAVAPLVRNLKYLEDPSTLELLLVLSLHQRRHELAEAWAHRLLRHANGAPGSERRSLLMRCLGLRPTPAEREAVLDVDALVLELIAQEPVIPALVAAQRVCPEPSQARLLAAAIERALPELSDQPAAFEALVRLSGLLGQHEAAKGWVCRGLEANPMSASLVLLREQLDPPRGDADTPREQAA